MIYVIYDTNVIVSSFLKIKSIPAKVVNYFYSSSKIVIPLYTIEILEEYKDVLSRSKFDIREVRINELLKKLINVGEKLDISDIEADLIDKSDIPFYKVFLKKRKSGMNVYLVTGNKKHFPIDPFILNPREFYELIEKIRYIPNIF